jgi:cytochrome c-type biogenesis protein CcmH/NrfG
MGPDFGAFPTVFVIVFVVAGLFILAVVAFIVTSVLRSRRVLRDSGLDPLAVPAQLAARFAQGRLATPAKTLEQRLSELDDLRARGLISPEEHDAARRAALSAPR